MPRTSVPTALYHVLEHLFHASLFAKAHLSEEEMEAIVEHAFFENYQFVLFEKVVNGSIGI